MAEVVELHEVPVEVEILQSLQVQVLKGTEDTVASFLVDLVVPPQCFVGKALEVGVGAAKSLHGLPDNPADRVVLDSLDVHSNVVLVYLL